MTPLRSILLLASLALFPAHLTRAADEPAPKTKQVESLDKSFTLEVPIGWVKATTANKLILMMYRPDIPRKTGESIDIFNVASGDSTRLKDEEIDEYVAAARRTSKDAGGDHFTEVEDTKLGGLLAKRYAFTKLNDRKRIDTHLRVAAIHNGAGYIFLYVCDSANAESGQKAFDAAVATLKWTDKK